ncbi:hypothetical protein KY290_019367 [Solanum tuberosum]|uniref:RING-CH-type domain-containing protein n=1 Tax=Solanum tuberosum TaxID=4113 RepID=A0ABQ7VGV7_SOLTU|nr:hypothetical protein KY284_018321 [Solanum tuberosum]KAH0763294.1 hypothetical protein KY290_019367 [Solanum tuberosum]
MRIVSNDSLVVDSSETEPILSQIAVVEESEDTSHSTEITEDCLETAGDLPSVGVYEIQSLSHAELSQCRICLDNEGEDLIAPCHCKGTQKYVHRSCLDNWRSTKVAYLLSHRRYVSSVLPSVNYYACDGGFTVMNKKTLRDVNKSPHKFHKLEELHTYCQAQDYLECLHLFLFCFKPELWEC